MKFQFYWPNWYKIIPYYNREEYLDFYEWGQIDHYGISVFSIGPFQFRWYS